MANELNLAYLPGSTVYAITKTANGLYVAGNVPGPFLAANWGQYAIPMPELTGGSGQYQGTFPGVSAGAYRVEVYLQAGGTPDLSDGPPVAEGRMDWSGTAETYNVSERTATADTLLTRDWTQVVMTIAPRSLLNAMRFLRNHWKIYSGTVTIFGEDDTTPAWSKPVVTTPGAEPVTEIGP